MGVDDDMKNIFAASFWVNVEADEREGKSEHYDSGETFSTGIKSLTSVHFLFCAVLSVNYSDSEVVLIS